MAIKLVGDSSGNVQEVDSSKNALVNLPGNKSDGTARGGGNANGAAILSENDPGTITASRYMRSPETDDDFRLRVGHELFLDDETFNYTGQNTGKHQGYTTTMTAAWSAAGYQTNSGSITTTNSGVSLRTYAMFSKMGSGQTLVATFTGAFSAQPVANCAIDFGLFLSPITTPYLPTDGVYFRIDSAGVKAVINNNGTEVETVLSFIYTNSTVYRWVITVTDAQVCFWINDVLYARIAIPIAQGSPFLSVALPVSIRQAHVGAAGGVLQFLLKNYSVTTSGSMFQESLGQRNNAIYGSYQGLSGGTMGGLTTYTNSTNPTAAVPSNTALTANLPSGLGGQAWETFTLAVNTDGIIMSYQVPAGTVLIPGKRLKIIGVKLSSFVQTVLAGGPLNRTFALNFGHTAVSLATTESGNSKIRRVVLLPELTQVVTAAQAVNTMISQPGGSISMFPEPIYVNPGEFIALAVKHIGTVGSSGTIATNIQYIYSWE